MPCNIGHGLSKVISHTELLAVAVEVRLFSSYAQLLSLTEMGLVLSLTSFVDVSVLVICLGGVVDVN